MTNSPMFRPSWFAAMLAVPMLAACTTPTKPIEVTRFHAPEIAAGQYGSIAVEAAPGTGETLTTGPYQEAVRAELGRIGFSPAAAGGGALVAEVRVTRSQWQPGRDGNPVSVGVGGSTGSYGSGLGVGVGIDLSGPPAEQVSTQLAVVIRNRASGQSVWEGRAEQVIAANQPLAQPAASARALAEALFVDFPGENGENYDVKQN